MKKLIWKNVGQTAAAIGILIAVWLVAYLAVGNGLLVPSFSASVKELGDLLKSALFWTGFCSSLLRTLVAFVISFFVAFIFAVASYLLPAFGRFFTPVISAVRSLPVLAVLLILLCFLDASKAPVAVAFLSLFPMLYAGILAALSGVDKDFIAVASVYGVRWYKRIWLLDIPLSASYILRESGAAISFSLKLVVSAEILANTAKSLGGMLQTAKIYEEIPQLFALVGVSFLSGLLLEMLFSWLTVWVEKRVKN